MCSGIGDKGKQVEQINKTPRFEIHVNNLNFKIDYVMPCKLM